MRPRMPKDTVDSQRDELRFAAFVAVMGKEIRGAVNGE